MTRILVTTGRDGIEGWAKKLQQSGIWTIKSHIQGEIHSSYSPVGDYPISMYGGFGVNCKNRVIVGGGLGLSNKELKDVFHWKSHQFLPMKPLNVGRSHCPSVYMPLDTGKQDGVLFVAGGCGEGKDTMEYLNIDDSLTANNWITCVDMLPYKVGLHQMTIYQGKLILSGGYNFSNGCVSNQVWEGTISIHDKLRVKWKSLIPMLVPRCNHVSLLINDNLYCIGGQNENSTEIYSFKNKVWEKGPDPPFVFKRINLC